MAVNLRTYNINIEQEIYVYGHPENIWDIFPVLDEYEFNQMLEIYIPNISNNRFNQKQYWIRYLMCRGAIHNVLNEFVAISQNYYYGIHITDFINFNHPEFNQDTLIHHAVKWCPNLELLQSMLNYGGELNRENADGNIPGENIHLTLWFNPFARILNMNIVVNHYEYNFGRQQEIDIWHVRNEDDFHNVIQFIRENVVRHVGINMNNNDNDNLNNNNNLNNNDNIDNDNIDNENDNDNDINFMLAQTNNMLN